MSESVTVQSIRHLSDQQQAEEIANKFARVSQEYDPLDKNDITVPPFCESSIPVFTPQQVRQKK